MKCRHGRKATLMLIVAISLCISMLVSSLEFFKVSAEELRIVENYAKKEKAHFCARSGFYAGLTALKKIKEKFLFQSGIALEPPPLPLGDCTIEYRLTPEDGKININYLVREFDDSESEKIRAILNNLFEFLNIEYTEIDKIVDFIDQNTTRLPNGMEEFDYIEKNLPVQTVKNYYLFGLGELFMIDGFSKELVFQSRKPKDYDETHSQDFMTDIEKAMITDDDWILANNITAYVTEDMSRIEKININSAPYFVLKSLHPDMTDQAIKRIWELRLNLNGYIDKKDLAKLNQYPEFSTPLPGRDATLYEILVGNGEDDELSGLIKTQGRYYTLKAIGTYQNVQATIEVLYDKKRRKVLYYKQY